MQLLLEASAPNPFTAEHSKPRTPCYRGICKRFLSWTSSAKSQKLLVQTRAFSPCWILQWSQCGIFTVSGGWAIALQLFHKYYSTFYWPAVVEGRRRGWACILTHLSRVIQEETFTSNSLTDMKFIRFVTLISFGKSQLKACLFMIKSQGKSL